MRSAPRSILVALCLLAMGVTAVAVPVLDQQQTLHDGGAGFGPTQFGYVALAQTFVPGIAGLLDRVSVQIEGNGFYPWPSDTQITLAIMGTSGGVPDNVALGSVTAALASPPGWFDFGLSGQGLFLTPGDLYAIVLTATYQDSGFPSAGVYWENNYTLGALYRSSNNVTWSPENTFGPADLQFRTYVDPDVQQGVPEPATLSLLVLGGLGLLRRRRKH